MCRLHLNAFLYMFSVLRILVELHSWYECHTLHIASIVLICILALQWRLLNECQVYYCIVHLCYTLLKLIITNPRVH